MWLGCSKKKKKKKKKKKIKQMTETYSYQGGE